MSLIQRTQLGLSHVSQPTGIAYFFDKSTWPQIQTFTSLSAQCSNLEFSLNFKLRIELDNIFNCLGVLSVQLLCHSSNTFKAALKLFVVLLQIIHSIHNEFTIITRETVLQLFGPMDAFLAHQQYYSIQFKSCLQHLHQFCITIQKLSAVRQVLTVWNWKVIHPKLLVLK